MTRSEAKTETSRQLSNARETLKLAKSQGAKTRATNKIDYLVAVQKTLCEPTREMVDKMRGEWESPGYYNNDGHFVHDCSKCGAPSNDEYPFCPACGAPMTDEAVNILWQRWKEAVNGEQT